MKTVFVVLGIIVFLAVEHPIGFWLVFVPMAALFATYLVKLYKKNGVGLSDLLAIMIMFVFIIVAVLLIVYN